MTQSPDRLIPPPAVEAVDTGPCSCSGARFLRSPLIFWMGVVWSALAIAKTIDQAGDPKLFPYCILAFLLLFLWPMGYGLTLWPGAGRWRHPRTYAVLLWMLLTLGVIVAMIANTYWKHRAERAQAVPSAALSLRVDRPASV